MSNFTLGRIGLDADIDDVAQWDASGETVAVAFSTPVIAEGGSLARSNAYRQMLLGYAESPDQRFVPVTWADDPTANGYYRVRSVSVTPDPDLGLDGLYYYSATLERVLGYGMPMIQTTYMFRARTTVHEVSAQAYLAAPSAGTRWGYAYEPEDETYSNQSPTRFLSTEDGGGVGVVLASVTGGSGPSAGELALWNRNIDPDAYYIGAPRLEVDGYPVEGRQVPRGWEDVWRLTNGHVELTMHADGIASGDVILQMRAWNGVAWSDPTSVSILGDDSATTPRDIMNGPDTLTVIRNTAEEVTIRLAMHVGTRNWPAFLDITCKRGIRTFECRYRRASGTGSANVAVQFEDHLTAYGWKRSGAWVSAGPEVDRNYMWNPRAILDTTYWDRYNGVGTATGRITFSAISSGTITTGFRATASGAHGPTTFGIEHGASGTNTPNNGLSAVQYTIAAWVRTSVARSLRLQVQWKTSAGANLTTATSADTAVAANTWTRITFTATAPATTARCSLRVTGVSGGANWAANDTLDATGLQMETGATVGNFWDGDGGGGSDALNDMYTYEDAPNTPSIRLDRTSAPTIWFVSPIATVADTDAWEPDPAVSADPPSWDFGFGLIASGESSGDENRYLNDIAAYYMSISQTDEVVAV